jgi:hypothetical protein
MGIMAGIQQAIVGWLTLAKDYMHLNSLNNN